MNGNGFSAEPFPQGGDDSPLPFPEITEGKFLLIMNCFSGITPAGGIINRVMIPMTSPLYKIQEGKEGFLSQLTEVSYGRRLLGDRSMVGQRTLTPYIQVRILVSQPNDFNN